MVLNFQTNADQVIELIGLENTLSVSEPSNVSQNKLSKSSYEPSRLDSEKLELNLV